MNGADIDRWKRLVKKSFGFMYKTRYGAFVVFCAVSAVLRAFQLLNCALSDVVAWPKSAHIALMLFLLLNIPLAMVLSLRRRDWKAAVVQLLFLAGGFAVYVFLAFLTYCTPTRMSSPPRAEWIENDVCRFAHIGRERIRFLGGMSQREPVVVFEVTGEEPVNGHFRPGSSWGDGDWLTEHFQTIMRYCRQPVSLPPDMEIHHCDSDNGVIHLLTANGKRYLVYKGL